MPQSGTELRNSHRHGRAQSRKAIEDRSTHLQFGDLTVQITRRDSFTEHLESTHCVSTRLRR